MTARKPRPALGSAVHAGMSIRDHAAALGVSKTELTRWISLGRLSQREFELRLDDHKKQGVMPSTRSLLRDVPARGRVQRVLGLVDNMTADEQAELRLLLPERLGEGTPGASE